ncbi:MAG: acyl transferase [Chitinophaga sp.]|jgi:Acyl-protein synthetase, LuxE|nr:acyl transferase [Chitinophaga sp.]
MPQEQLINNIFKVNSNFETITAEVFSFQYQNNKVYHQWCNLINTENSKPEIRNLNNIPFLPISFYKTHIVTSTLFTPQQIFESSGTTTAINSQHLVKDINIYKTSFLKAFELFYGEVKDWCVIGLLPSYLERNNSSLVMMVDEMIKLSNNPKSGFYLNEFDKLKAILTELENANQKTLLIGVTFGLLDFAEKYTMQLKHTVVMETGGMKGRRRELTRSEVHSFLKENLGVTEVHSEYGMTELLSQAYSKSNGRFVCPPWMKVLVRGEEDPLQISLSGKGILNVIDLANIYSCSFIATDDAGIVYEDGSFEVIGRVDNSDIRGCSLLVV